MKDDARNTVRTVTTRKVGTFELRLGRRIELVSETHDGDTTILTLRRRPRVELAQ